DVNLSADVRDWASWLDPDERCSLARRESEASMAIPGPLLADGRLETGLELGVVGVPTPALETGGEVLHACLVPAGPRRRLVRGLAGHVDLHAQAVLVGRGVHAVVVVGDQITKLLFDPSAQRTDTTVQDDHVIVAIADGLVISFHSLLPVVSNEERIGDAIG